MISYCRKSKKMDESWRMRIGTAAATSSNCPPRRSTEDTTSNLRRTISDDPLNPEDFADVFGGPPRTVLSRQFSNYFPGSSSSAGFFCEDIFQQTERAATSVGMRGRSLPQFRIPSSGKKLSGESNQQNRQNDGFYSDIFGWDDERAVRSRSRSKTSSSSALSSEELSPLCPAISDGRGYDDVSLFASKLRPIKVRSTWNSTGMGRHDDCQRQKGSLPSAGGQSLRESERDFLENSFNYSFRSTLESINLEAKSNSCFGLPVNSPSSAVSLACQSERELKPCEIEDEILRQDVVGEAEDESVCSYVIEINSGNREWICESNDVDEAIAWAKEKSQANCSEGKPIEELPNGHQFSASQTDSFQPMDELRQDEWAIEEESSKMQEQMQLLDEKIKLWSAGKEADIRLLLSSLHHVLWPNSGWVAMPLMNLIESSQVKKAYQRAQLCLHPDKLQQRGATLPQKHVAGKVFSALQDAWASFISTRDVHLPLTAC